MSRLNRWVPLAAVVTLLGAAMLAAIYANPSIPVVPLDPPGAATPQSEPTLTVSPASTSSESPEQIGYGEPLPAWLANTLSALCGVVILLLFALMGWLLLRDRLAQRRVWQRRAVSAAPSPGLARAQVGDALDAGLAELDDSDIDPRRAVISCWVRLEHAAAAAGTPRKVGDTSTDLVARLLDSHQISAEVLAMFADVYRQARFAAHTVDESMRDQARAALRQVRDELRAARP